MTAIVDQVALPIAFVPDSVVGDHWSRVLRALRDAIEGSIGMKEAAYICDAQPSSLCDALAERERKPFHARWLVALLVRMPAKARGLVLAELADAAGYEVAEAKPLTAEERLAALEASIVEQFGPAGERVLQQHRARRRR